MDEFSSWCYKELNGYPFEEEKKPNYRLIRPIFKAWNPYRGFIPVLIEDEDLLSTLSTQFVNESIDQIESILSRPKDTLIFTVRPEVQELFMRSSSVSFEVSAHIDKSQFFNILQSVRNIVLDWTLELEKNDISGEGLIFSKKEREVAQGQIVNYGTLIYGDMVDSTVQRDISNSYNTYEGLSLDDLKKLVDQIDRNKESSGIATAEIEIVKSAVNDLRIELENKIPNPTKIGSLFRMIKNIYENAVGSIIASGIIFEINKWFPS